MVSKKRTWVLNPQSRSNPKVPDGIKIQVQTRANHLIESELKPKHINPPPKDKEFNYIVDIYSKWHQSYFYFCAKYRCPSPNCISEFFEVKFARLEYIEDNRFNLSYMRHTGQWFELYTEMSLDECMAAIRSEPHFLP